VSHFAGNRQVFGRAEPLTAHGGSAKTILCGEVVSEFKAWGDPGNLRDPSDGINASPSGFGGTDEQGAYFLMLDGSSRFIRADVDPRVLQALAAPD
ncbi:MAG TPA: hypothetical protein VGN42_02100, partial [Pirellulales bacterium]|nr:hypothetical protein [Pirellulales bacterium]